MKTTLTAQSLSATRASLKEASASLDPRRQPIHVVYGGAHLFKAETASKLAEVALRSLEEHAPDARTLARALGLAEEGSLAE
ncbi:MAG TPA: phosphoenolpyruvate kinase, partial [Archangium sp.]|uniref:DUF6986 family protein n=1 Tax=Archangium sp. TaxID=1872627 RepID=UPI002EEAAA50